jgi:hypothetical protein
MQKDNGRQMTEDGCQVMAKAHIAFELTLSTTIIVLLAL